MATAIQRAVDSIRTGQSVFRDARRFQQIVVVLARHGFGAFVQRLAVGDAGLLRTLAALQSKADDHVPFERRVLHAFQDLGPTFVKLGQILSTRPDILPPAIVEELKSLQDDVPEMPLDDVRAVIEEELGAPVEELLGSFSEAPLACASIAQVHRGTLKTGEEVVLKVQRRNIVSQVEADLEIMGFLARSMEANFPGLRILNPSGIVAEFERALLKELDFDWEIQHIERFRRNFADSPEVHFPVPYPALCTPRVLCMEFVRGTKISLITPDRWDVQTVVSTGVDAVVKMIFVDGFFHGDVHPGNLLVRDDGTLIFIDFGLCGRLTRRQRDMMVDLLVAVVREDFEGVARVFWKLGIHTEETTQDYEAFQSDVIELMERWFAGKTMDELEFAGVLKDLMDGALKHRIRMPPQYTMTFKALITMEGVAKQLAPEMDVIRTARPYVLKMAAERYSPQNLLRIGLDTARDLSETLSALPLSTKQILDDLRGGRTLVNIELRQLRDAQRTYAKAQGRRGLALVTAAFALCGTVALDKTSLTFLGFPAVSFWFYVAGAIFLVWFLVSAGPSRGGR